jgi:glycerate dehydrogenase
VFLKGEDLPPTLGLIAVGSTGTERIDLAACRARGVHVCNERDALLINCARGGSVDEFALAEALAEGRIGGAGIDSLKTEPTSPDNPLLRLKLDNLIVTPHVAWASQGSLANLAEQLIQNIEAFVLGSPRNLVA